MSDHSARPRVESHATFYLQIDQLVLDTCSPYTDGQYEPTWAVIGEGENGSVILDDIAPVTEEDGVGNTYCIALLVVGAQEAPRPMILDNVVDDAPVDVPEYLRVGGPECFNPEWHIINALKDTRFPGISTKVGAGLAYKALTSEMPAGTEITYDWEADFGYSKCVAVLVTNASLDTEDYRSTTCHELSTYDIEHHKIYDFPPEGAIIFTASTRYDGHDQSCLAPEDPESLEGSAQWEDEDDFVLAWADQAGDKVVEKATSRPVVAYYWIEYPESDFQGHVGGLWPGPHCDSVEGGATSDKVGWFITSAPANYPSMPPEGIIYDPEHTLTLNPGVQSIAFRARGEELGADL